jgi:hypothetical protein
LESTATEAPKPKKGYFFKVLGLTVATSFVYSGIVYQAAHDEEFKKTYLKYAPGGQDTLDFVEELERQTKDPNPERMNQLVKDQLDNATNSIKNLLGMSTEPKEAAPKNILQETSTSAPVAEEQSKKSAVTPVPEPTNLTTSIPNTPVSTKNLDQIEKDVAQLQKEITKKTEKVAEKVSEKAQEAKQAVSEKVTETLSHVESAATKFHETVEKKVEQVKNEITYDVPNILQSKSGNYTLANPAPKKAAAKPAAKKEELKNDIVYKIPHHLEKLKSDDVSVDSVYRSIEGFLNSINAAGGARQDIIEQYNKLAARLSILNNRLIDLKTDSQASLESLKKEADAKLQDSLFAERQQNEVVRGQLIEELRSQFSQEKARIEKEFLNHLEDQLSHQASVLERWWRRESKLLVDRERNGRLSKLDDALKQLRLLEQATIDNTTSLVSSRQLKQWTLAVESFIDRVEDSARAPFVPEFKLIQSLAANFPVAKAVVGSLDASVSRKGLDTLNDLKDRFKAVREEVSRVSLVEEDSGLFGHTLSYVLSLFMFKKEGLVQGDDVEAVLARTQTYLDRNDLESATREANQLNGWPKKIAVDWIKSAVAKLEYEQAAKVNYIILFTQHLLIKFYRFLKLNYVY